MTSLTLFLGLLASLSSSNSGQLDYLYDNLSYEEKSILSTCDTVGINESEEFITLDEISYSKNSSGSSSNGIENVKDYLSKTYTNYIWQKAEGKTTKDVTNAIPINVCGSNFPSTEIATAIENTGVPSSYGGCGPIAMMGVLDYFSRYLGYKEIINDPTSSENRISLAEDVLKKSKTFEVGFSENKNTLMFPWDYKSAFNSLISDYGLDGIIESKHRWKMTSGYQSEYFEAIVESVNKGIPVTLMTGLWSGDGDFAKHYTNIFGYEKWTGLNLSTNEKIEKSFIVGRLNWRDYEKEYYCDSQILNDGMIGLVTYDINYENSYNVYASDFAEKFVNSSGGGQYFFYDKSTYVSTASGRMFYTNRKRCSYIENQYLVLSPNRKDAGEAYLDILLPHSASKITFSASLWGSREGIIYEDFRIQYFTNNWINHVNFDLASFSTLKNFPDEFTVVLPKNATRFRFIATHSKPSGDRNKGRIVLDNLKFEYNLDK